MKRSYYGKIIPMNKENVFLKDYIKKLESFRLPDYSELPSIPLYMEQVVCYVEECLNDFCKTDAQNIITPFMINNYVKAKIINPPKEKKYSQDHIAYLLAISLLKSVVQMKDIATLIDLDKNLITDNRNLYNFFKNIQEETLKNQVHKTKVRLESLQRTEKKSKKGEKIEDVENLNLAYIALRLYIESETTKQLADTIMSQVSQKVLSKNVLVESHKEKRLVNKKNSNEAKKIGTRKKI